MLLDSASRLPPGEVDLQTYFLRSGISCLNQATDLDPSDAEVKVALAGLHADGEGAVMQGVMLLREVVEADSMNVAANLKLGELSMISGQYQNAIERFRTAVAGDSENIDAWIGLGNANLAVGNEAEALDALIRASALLDTGSLKAAIDQKIIELKN